MIGPRSRLFQIAPGGSPAWRAGAALAAALTAAAVVAPTAAVAQEAPAAPAPPPAGPCVEVDIGGQRTGTLDCVNQALRDARTEARAASGDADPGRTLNARSADHRVGLTNDAAFRQRMGAAYGVSIRPQRPTPVYRPILPVSPPSPR